MKKLVILLALLSAMNARGQWVLQQTPTTTWLNSVYVLNATTVFAAGNNETILKTTNAGTNWIKLREGTGWELHGIWFLNSNTGMAAGATKSNFKKGIIFRTTNGGTSWDSLTVDSLDIRALYFVNSSTGFIGGWSTSYSNSPIYKTTNAGLNWIHITAPANNYGIEDYHFINEYTGWATGDGLPNEIVIKTTNSGNNWSVVSTNLNGAIWLCSVAFVNANTGWVTGNQGDPHTGLIRKTTDGGVTWTVQLHNNVNETYEPYFINENTGWIVGDSPNIQKTTNGGINWNVQTTPAAWWMWDIMFADQLTGWAVGSQGKIFYTTNGGGTVSVQNISAKIPSKYSLSQNYPNPFNPISNIKYKISKSTDVRITVFDVTGKEVEVLVDEKQSPGEYLVTFDGTMLTSGVYFYRMVTKDFTETKRMLMIK